MGSSILRLGSEHSIDAPHRGQLDLRDLSSLRRYIQMTRPDIVINSAAYTNTEMAELNPIEAFELNHHMVKALCEELSQYGASLIHFSSDYVYDGLKKSPYVESDTCAPLSEYGRSKFLADEEILSSQVSCIILRVSWVFSSIRSNFLKTMLRLVRDKDEISVVANQYGSPTSADFIAMVTLKIVQELVGAEAGKFNGVYHLSPKGSTSWYGFASYICRKLDEIDENFSSPALNPIDWNEYPTSIKRPSNSVLCNNKIERTFGVVRPDWRPWVLQGIRSLL